MKLPRCLLLWLCWGALALIVKPAIAEQPADYVAGNLITLNDNGAWSWFMDERAIVQNGKLIVGSVRAVGNFESGRESADWGNVEVAVHDIDAGTTQSMVFDRNFEQDDHDCPAFLALPDGRVLAVYTRHAVERKVFYRRSAANNPLEWGPVREFETPGHDSPRVTGDNATYSNLFCLASGRILNFFRGPGYDPNFMYSDDDGQSWTYGGRLLRGRDGYGPYTKYAFDAASDTVHFVSTEDHPRHFDNGLYHGFVCGGQVYGSDGTLLAPSAKDTETTLLAWDPTPIFTGDPDNVAWMVDLELDADKRPCVIFSVQKDGRGLPRGKGGFDHRFHYARWDGSKWQSHEIAYAGTRLYSGEDDYTGLAAIDPKNTNIIYISTDAEPQMGQPLVSSADGKRHHELFRGTSGDGGATWRWTPITANSTINNLRPIVPKWNDPRTALLWMRGSYSANHGEWTTAIVALIQAY